LLSVGNPRFDATRFSDLPDLPSAAREARAVASYYRDPVVLLEKAATTGAAEREFNGADIIELATHAVPDPKSPLLSKLLFAPEPGAADQPASDGALRAYSIYRMKLPRTRLVVLSACETGVERAYRGEGAIGLARPFMAGTVPMVVASLWPVDSAETADLMISLHKYRKRDGLSTTEALRRAQLDAVHSLEPGLSSNAWAAFAVIGGYAQF
jgi:CHAT domain-containing protein